jgi:hypothetical protein
MDLAKYSLKDLETVLAASMDSRVFDELMLGSNEEQHLAVCSLDKNFVDNAYAVLIVEEGVV